MQISAENALPSSEAVARSPVLVRGGRAFGFAWRAMGEALRTVRAARPGEKLSLALVVLRMRAKQFLIKFSPRWRFGSERVLGWTVECFDYNSLVFLIEEIVLRRHYEFVAGVARPLIFDCGSNIGLALLYFKRLYPEARVVAFEPSATTFEVLARNVVVNGLQDVELHNVALHEAAGELRFYEDPAQPGSGKNSLRTERTGGRPSIVNARPLSEFVCERVDFLKMDIEGAEEGVLAELAQSGKLKLVQQMVIEYHHHINPREDRLSRLLGLLEDNGFGYQLRVPPVQPFSRESFQDLLIYAYQK